MAKDGAATATRKAKKPKDRGFATYFPKMCKANKTAARSEVHKELEKMLYFALGSVVDGSSTILNEYATKEETVKPKIVQAALSTILCGDLKAAAIGAGVDAEVARIKKAKAAAAAKPKGDAAAAAAVEAGA